jgi:hypothetical protein
MFFYDYKDMSKYVFNNTLVGKKSRFSEEMFIKYDIPARDRIKKSLGDFVEDNPDMYKQDLVIKDDDYKYKYIELQVCSGWIGNTYPYEKVWVYERKGCYDVDTLFITLNHDLSRCFIFDAASFKNTKPRRIKKYGREFVFDIPWNRIMPISTESLTPEALQMY